MQKNEPNSQRYRIFLIVVFVLAFFAFAVIAIFRKNSSGKLAENIEELAGIKVDIERIDASITALYDIENQFRLYTATYDKKYFNEYTYGLNQVALTIDSLEKSKLINDEGTSSLELNKLLKDKEAKAALYIRIKHLTDSLVSSAPMIDKLKPSEIEFQPFKSEKLRTVIITDTIRPVAKAAKGGIFKRIKEAIANKPAIDSSKKKIVRTVIKKDTNSASVAYNNRQLRAINEHFRNLVKQQSINKHRLNAQELELLDANDKLIRELTGVFKELKQLELTNADQRKHIFSVKAQNGLDDLDHIVYISLAVLFVLLLVILANIRRLYVYDKSLHVAKNEAERQARVKGDFLANMSHEIRTPLNSIHGFSEQLAETPLNEEQQTQLNAIRLSSKILLSTVNDILDLSKLEIGKVKFDMAPFSPRIMIEEVIATMEVQANNKGIKLVGGYDFDKSLSLLGDAFRLKQILINLLSNAIKFTHEGVVTVNCSIAAKQVNKQSILHVDVIDTGVGIPEKHIKTIFDEFIQVPGSKQIETQSGTGLGLAICKKIVELQNGKISLKSEEGKGSVFSFYIPYTSTGRQVEIPVASKRAESYDSAILSKKTILVVEDNELNILLVKMILKKWKVNFDLAQDGEEAFDLFKNKHYDVVLTDIQMPKLSGVELTKMIRALDDKEKSITPILAITANVMKEDVDGYIAAGMNDYILKPFVEREMFEKVMKYV